MIAPTHPDKWRVLDSGTCHYAFNMALDETLLELAVEVGQPVLRFYGWVEPAASFGYFQSVSEIERVTSLRPLVRRPTGGGLVPHDADWTYSVVIPREHAWYAFRASESYERVHRWIQDSFTGLNVATELAPCCRKEAPGQCFAGYEKSDVLWLGRKIAGAAQRRTKSGLLIQGSMQPQPGSITRGQWQESMVRVAQEGWGASFASLALSPAISERAAHLTSEKYSKDAHNRRR